MHDELIPPDRLAAIEARLETGGDRMDRMERAINENTDLTVEVRDLLAALKGGMKVLGWLGVLAKWIGVVASAAVAIYTAAYIATHGGELPK